jgi:DnaJ-domain-containing protein 1
MTGRDRFHGRVAGKLRRCAHAGCLETGEFRAPDPYGREPGFDGPGDWQWLCLDHVRAFNARYNFFDGMSREEIEDAQMPGAGWATETRAFRATAGVDTPPRWADFHDPLEAISARFKAAMPAERSDGRPLTPEDRRALKALGLDATAESVAIRSAYSALVRRYHPDRNGGDRSHEKKLRAVIEAYQHLRQSAAFSG